MNLHEKSDAASICDHLKMLKKAAWISPAQRWWPDFLFHFTDVQNAVNILRSDELLCRTHAASSGLMITNGASPEIISRTNERWKDYVRLYFRPRTPTQYNNEGFRPPDQRKLGSHCPFPIYFLFNAEKLLCRQETMFTIGNLAAGASPQIDATNFKQIPFELVYHDRRFEQNERDTIIYHRHAEAIIPQRLDLSALEMIRCRTQAEYETFLYLLPPMTRTRWARRIGIGADLNLFFKRWTFIETATLTATQAVFHFNRATLTPGPFRARVEITKTFDGAKYFWENTEYMANDTLRLDLANLGNPVDYSLRFLLNDDLAFTSRHQEESSLPF